MTCYVMTPKKLLIQSYLDEIVAAKTLAKQLRRENKFHGTAFSRDAERFMRHCVKCLEELGYKRHIDTNLLT